MSQSSSQAVQTDAATSDGIETPVTADVTAEDLGETTAQSEADDDLQLSKDDLFHLLQNERRRAVLQYLRGREDEAVRMRDVAEQVAAWEHDTTVQALTSDERQRVYIALYQSHLDKLDDAGVIEYNKPRGIVRTTPLFPEVATYVDAVADRDEADDDSWNQRYLGASAVSSLLLVGSALDVSVLQLLSGFAVSVAILAVFSMLTLVRLHRSAEDSVTDALPTAQ
ncbi:hypothetical protein ACKVMT_07355 [Halobacteriales archaeon Cl-PHB]